jgi:GNAT superfamily N-acetyltransferase
VETGPSDIYVAAFVARCGVMRRPGQAEVDEPGVHGLLPSIADPHVRLLVTNDLAYDVVAPLLADARDGVINVFAAAARCAKLIEGHAAWRKSRTATAMVCRDLRALPTSTLPRELTLRPVRRLPGDAPGGVPLEEAVAAAMLADPRIDDPPTVFADYLRSLPSALRLFAALDGNGTVRATSGSGAFGMEASVMFVNTDPDWRGRGIGQAMTAAALRAAQESGARRACLDATGPGLRIYLRLGFEAISRTTRFSAAPASAAA